MTIGIWLTIGLVMLVGGLLTAGINMLVFVNKRDLSWWSLIIHLLAVLGYSGGIVITVISAAIMIWRSVQ
jgi:hypothetical protein